MVVGRNYQSKSAFFFFFFLVAKFTYLICDRFLRDHGLSEGSHNKVETPVDVKKEQSPFQESYLQTVRSLSPSGRVTLRGGGNTSSSLASTRSSSKSSDSRSRSPLPGFMDGDKYVSMDEAGNHMVVKMKKAENDAKMPLVKKKL